MSRAALRPFVRDPLDALEVPPAHYPPGLQLQYRQPHSLYDRRGLQLALLGSAVQFTAVLLALRILGLWLATDFVFSILLLAAVLVSCRFTFPDWQTLYGFPLLAVAFWFGMILVKHLSVGAYAALFTLFALIVACILADQVTTNYVSWLLANPRLSNDTVSAWRATWKRRFHNPSELPGYLFGFGIVALSALLSMAATTLVTDSPYLGMCFVTVMAFLMLVFTVVSMLWRAPDVEDAVSHTWAAINDWFYYKPEQKPVPGMYQPPHTHNRARHTDTALLLLVLGLLPLAAYFPFHMMLVPGTPWAQTAALGWPWDDMRDKPPLRDTVLDANRANLDRLAHYRPELAQRYRERLVQYADASETYVELSGEPESWLLVAVRGLFTGDSRYVWALVCAVVPSIVVPPMVLLTILFAVVGRGVPLVAARLRRLERRQGNDFDFYVERLLDSRYVFPDGAKERDHIWLGVDTDYGRPILLSRDILNGHAHILGSTQSGKTSLCLSPMLPQMIRALDPGSRNHRRQSSIVIIDLKGDPALFHGVRHECQNRGLTFKHFTNRFTDATFAFNPFEQTHLRDVSPEQRVDMLARAMGIFYGNKYPEVYWSDMNAHVFRNLLFGYPDIRSFARFHYYRNASQFECHDW